MPNIKEMTMDVAASLWIKPATFEDLYARDIESLKYLSEYAFDRILKSARSKGWIYEKNKKYYCYKKTVVNILNPAGYEL